MLDQRDHRILMLLQQDASLPVTAIAETVALSVSACSRRIARLEAEGYIARRVALLDRKRMGVPTTVFAVVKTATHSVEWLEAFNRAVATIPEIVEVHRLTGNFDYIVKLVLPNVEYYDVIYKKLVAMVPLVDISAYISMEAVKDSAVLPTNFA